MSMANEAEISATQAAVQQGIHDISQFVQTLQFRGVLTELWALPPERRANYVLKVLLDPEQLKARGVTVPSDLVIQRSTFRDNRPTLFCVVKHLEPGLLWEKVTITIDNPDGEPALKYADVVPSGAPRSASCDSRI